MLAAVPAAAQRAGLGRAALPEEIAAWDIAVRPDGAGLPPGAGSVRAGEALYLARCASCHGEFGEGVGRWPALAGGQGSLAKDMPEKTIGSYWPFASTTFDYIRRAMPFGNARSLTDAEAYALTAFLLNMNGIVGDEFVLTRESFAGLKLPNAPQFYDDDREVAEHHFWNRTPCMVNCKGPVAVTGHARVVDVTPEDAAGVKAKPNKGPGVE